jgi:hypothetical protein
MSEPTDRRCPDCKAPLDPIKLFARTPIRHGDADGAVIRYATPEAQKGTLSWCYDTAGKVHAMLCSKCLRIFLFGEPNTGEAEGS